MNESRLFWKEYVNGMKNNEVQAVVDLNLGHALLQSKFAPIGYRVIVKLAYAIIFMSALTAIVLFFFVQWWIPILILFATTILSQRLRRAAAQEVINLTFSNEDFYVHAVLSGALKTYRYPKR